MFNVNNPTPMGTFYPAYGGPTLGEVGSAPAMTDAPDPVNTASKNEVVQAQAVGGLGNPLVWWAVLVAMLFGLMFIAKRWGSEASEFASIKLSVYNIVVITLAAIIGINFFKMVFTRFKVPGLTTMVQAV